MRTKLLVIAFVAGFSISAQRVYTDPELFLDRDTLINTVVKESNDTISYFVYEITKSDATVISHIQWTGKRRVYRMNGVCFRMYDKYVLFSDKKRGIKKQILFEEQHVIYK